AGGCLEGQRQHVVTLRVVNTLSRPVAHFVLRSDPSSVSSASTSGARGTLNNLKLGCGLYLGWWSGFLPNGQEAPSRIYAAQLFIDGKPAGSSKMLNSK